MDDTQFEELNAKLTIITKLLALNLVRDVKIQKDQIIALSSFGFKPSEIAELLGTTANTVNVALSRDRKKREQT